MDDFVTVEKPVRLRDSAGGVMGTVCGGMFYADNHTETER